MSHGVHAVQHEAEHQMEHDAKHGGHGEGHDKLNKRVALLIAFIALFLAFSETLGKSAQTAALNYQIEASNLWNFFQAKNIRRTATIVGDHAGEDDSRAGGLKAADQSLPPLYRSCSSASDLQYSVTLRCHVTSAIARRFCACNSRSSGRRPSS